MEDFSDPRVARHATFVTPDGFVKGGQQLNPLRRELEDNKHLSRVTFHQDQVFKQAVKAAVTTFDNTNEHEHVNKTIIHADGAIENGILDWRYHDVIVDVVKETVKTIFENKVVPIIGDNNMSLIVTGWQPFGLCTVSYKNNRDKFKLEPDGIYSTPILVCEDKHDFYYINPKDDFSYQGCDNRNNVVKMNRAEKYKVVFPKAGSARKKALNTRILGPGQIHTDKFLCIMCDSIDEARNLEKYFNSDFYRAGFEAKLVGWNLMRSWHSFLPIVDSNPATSDIDWSESTESISDQMYRKFGFTAVDVAMIHKFLGQHEKSSFVDDSELDSVIAAASPSLYTVSDTLGDTADGDSAIEASGPCGAGDSVVGESGGASGGEVVLSVASDGMNSVSDEDVAVDGNVDTVDGGECVE